MPAKVVAKTESDEIFIFETQKLVIYVFSKSNRTVKTFSLVYTPTDLDVMPSKQGVNHLPTNNIIVQIGNPAKVFMIGGGSLDHFGSKMLKECRQLFYVNNTYELKPVANLKFSRLGHSVCSLSN